MKLLTGKCKEDFEEWLSEWYDQHITGFYILNKSMQWGVIQDFADSVGITMDAFGYSFEKGAYNGAINDKAVSLKDLKSLNEAREQAIIKFNKIYNESK